jgi:hypothetical protein
MPVANLLGESSALASLPGGWWLALELYLASLLQAGTLLETAGSHEDAAHAFEEGYALVRSCTQCDGILLYCCTGVWLNAGTLH